MSQSYIHNIFDAYVESITIDFVLISTINLCKHSLKLFIVFCNIKDLCKSHVAFAFAILIFVR